MHMTFENVVFLLCLSHNANVVASTHPFYELRNEALRKWVSAPEQKLWTQSLGFSSVRKTQQLLE